MIKYLFLLSKSLYTLTSTKVPAALWQVLWIGITLILIPLLSLIRIRIRLSLWCGSGSWSCSLSKLCESASTDLQSHHGSIFSLCASIVSVYDPKLLNFDSDVDPDSDHAFDFDADPDPTFYALRIRIRLPKMMRTRTRNAGYKLPSNNLTTGRTVLLLLRKMWKPRYYQYFVLLLLKKMWLLCYCTCSYRVVFVAAEMCPLKGTQEW